MLRQCYDPWRIFCGSGEFVNMPTTTHQPETTHDRCFVAPRFGVRCVNLVSGIGQPLAKVYVRSDKCQANSWSAHGNHTPSRYTLFSFVDQTKLNKYPKTCCSSGRFHQQQKLSPIARNRHKKKPQNGKIQ
jgi:hypothetical protein